jgi:hypothetical protein
MYSAQYMCAFLMPIYCDIALDITGNTILYLGTTYMTLPCIPSTQGSRTSPYERQVDKLRE